MLNLTGKLLIASPSTESDSYFAKSVIYIIKSDLNGSVGVIVNSPFMTLNGSVTVSNDSHNKENLEMKDFHTYSGGPVDIERGFILQLQKGNNKSERIVVTSNLETLRKLSKKLSTAKNCIFIFGHCGWEAGQLEEELRNNYWFIAEASKEIVFSVNDQTKWTKALENLKITPLQYSSLVGNC